MIRIGSLLAPAPGSSGRRSNRVTLHVVPKLSGIAPVTRWVEGETATLDGLAFKNGLQMRAEDWSVNPPVTYMLSVGEVTRTTIKITIPPAPLGPLRGVRRIVVRNPDGGESREEHVARISDTIVVRCAAFRVIGKSPGIGTKRSEPDIASLFNEDAPGSISIPWAPARLVFKLVQPVKTITIDDDLANLWQKDKAADQKLFNDHGGVKGALNFFFFPDVEGRTAYAHSGQGLCIIGDEGEKMLGSVDFQEVVAHEAGHAMCLHHYCAKSGEDAEATLLGRACQSGDKGNLMYPHWNVSNKMELVQAQIDAARTGATHIEDGKTSLSAPFEINRCAAADTTN